MADRPPLHTVAVGISWHTAPAELRDRCFVPPERHREILDAVREDGVEEVLLVSTCNRVEFWMAASDPERAAACAIDRWEALCSPGAGWRRSLNTRFHDQAVQHVFRVASSVDSIVPGETQIPTQVLSAWRESRDAGCSGWFLGRLVQASLAASKRVRSTTGVGRGATSVAGAAVDLARKVVGEMAGLSVAVVGAGEMAEIAVTGFVRAGARDFVFANRTEANAARLRNIHPGRLEPLSALGNVLEGCDVLVSATSAPGFVVTRPLVEQAMRERRSPLLLVDIAAPRDIDPACARVPGVFLYGIDDLERVVEGNRRDRGEEVGKAERILEDESRKFVEWVRELAVIPLLSKLREDVHATARDEVERFAPKLARARDAGDSREVLEDFARALANKFLHQPTVGARQAAASGREQEIAAALRDLFHQENRE